MSREYATKGTSHLTAQVQDIPLDPADGVSGELRRKILRAEVVHNKKDANKPIKVTILYQKRHSKEDPWEDTDSFNLVTLKTGQEVRLSFSCSETHQLYKVLEDLHTIGSSGVPEGEKKLAVVNPDEETIVKGEPRRILHEILESEGEGVWSTLDSLRPGLLEVAALNKQHQQRTKAIAAFQERISDPAYLEDKWQAFFVNHDWIFGHGLDYRFLHQIRAQVNCGGTELDGTGAPKGDFLMATKAKVGFTVLVEIKTPHTPLLGKKYRNKAYQIGEHLSGGVAQLQAQCAEWAEEGSRQRNNSERLLREEIYTYEPKGILVIGTTCQLMDDPDKRSTFERFRRNLHNPEILTFDELLKRAEFMVNQPEIETHA
jgi:hypothetical protein